MSVRRRFSARNVPSPDLIDMVASPVGGPWDGVAWSLRVEACRRAWPAWRDEVIAQGYPGSRGWAWWLFEAEAPYPGSSEEAQVSALLAVGGIDDAELEAAAVAYARTHNNELPFWAQTNERTP